MYLTPLYGTTGAPAVTTSADYYRAKLFCVGKLMPSVIGYDARTAGLDLPVPFLVIQGCDDNRTLPDAARAFVGQVRAPAKNYTAIEGGDISPVSPILRASWALLAATFERRGLNLHDNRLVRFWRKTGPDLDPPGTESALGPALRAVHGRES